MSLSRVVDAFADHLGPLTAPTPVGPARPAAGIELPAVALSLDRIEQALTSIGATPAPSRSGALAVTQDLDLADPTVTFPDGERVRGYYETSALGLSDHAPSAWAGTRWFLEQTRSGEVIMSARTAMKEAGVKQPVWFYMAPGDR